MLLRGAANPRLHESAGDAVTGAEPGNFRANFHYLAGTIGKRDARQLHAGIIVSQDYQKVAVVQRVGVNTNQHFTGPRPRHRCLAPHQGIQPEGLYLNELHPVGFSIGIRRTKRCASPFEQTA